MAPDFVEPVTPNGFRRRVILELAGPEMAMLDAATRRHGTKRAALVAGLVAEADAQAEPTPADGTANAGPMIDSEAASRLEAERDERAAHIIALEVERDAALADAAELRDQLEAECAESLTRYRPYAEAVADLEDRIPDALFCARCGEWAPDKEWTWRDDGPDAICFHSPCGDHAPGIVTASSWLARQAAPENSTP